MSFITETRWRAKLAAKVALARLPISYATWRRVGIFRHGDMNSPGYAVDAFERAVGRAGLEDVGDLRILELGPGDSVFSAVIAFAAGARHSTLVDVDDFADRDLAKYRALGRELAARGYADPGLDGISDFATLLDRCRVEYLTDGLASLRLVPSASIDFTWSQSTLEHVRLDELPAVLGELRRIMADGGTASHLVDLGDHLGDSLNNLRFRRDRWESPLMAKSGFYTNRVRSEEMLDLLRAAGFSVEVVEARRWDRLPTPRARMDPAYRALTDDELRVQTLIVRLEPA